MTKRAKLEAHARMFGKGVLTMRKELRLSTEELDPRLHPGGAAVCRVLWAFSRTTGRLRVTALSASPASREGARSRHGGEQHLGPVLSLQEDAQAARSGLRRSAFSQ